MDVDDFVSALPGRLAAVGGAREPSPAAIDGKTEVPMPELTRQGP